MTFNQKSIQIIAATVLLLLLSVGITSAVQAKTITDMKGRKVTLPEPIRKVYAPSPYGSYIMYSVDPSLLAGLIFPIREEDKKYYPQAVRTLPVIGSLFGQGQAANIEVLFKARPDLLIMWATDKAATNQKPRSR